jgi:EAL domain-containing protein (putative c-di-GMP-specific phosphodiesterase class I)
VVQTATERITGFEALLRWHHPKQGFIAPDKFIPIAEDTGLIAAIGEWALRTACQDLAQWPEDVRVAVNVSPLQFANPALPTIVTSALAHAGVEPGRLELEITESVFLNNDEGTDQMFKQLKSIGVRLALDDFGTGYSSLGYCARPRSTRSRSTSLRARRDPAGQSQRRDHRLDRQPGRSAGHGNDGRRRRDAGRTGPGADAGCSHVQGYIYERPLSALNAAARLSTGLVAVAQGRARRAPAASRCCARWCWKMPATNTTV